MKTLLPQKRTAGTFCKTEWNKTLTVLTAPSHHNLSIPHSSSYWRVGVGAYVGSDKKNDFLGYKLCFNIWTVERCHFFLSIKDSSELTISKKAFSRAPITMVSTDMSLRVKGHLAGRLSLLLVNCRCSIVLFIRKYCIDANFSKMMWCKVWDAMTAAPDPAWPSNSPKYVMLISSCNSSTSYEYNQWWRT